nr:helix-turn-helix domain-containing protein [Mesorhizobium sp. dw_380]
MRHLGISVRTLERCCLRQFNQTPNQLNLRSRLQAARNLLFYEEREIKDVATSSSRARCTHGGGSRREWFSVIGVTEANHPERVVAAWPGFDAIIANLILPCVHSGRPA